MDQLVGLLDVQLRNLTPGGKDSAARSLNKVGTLLCPRLSRELDFLLAFLHFMEEKNWDLYLLHCLIIVMAALIFQPNKQ